ncbi:hypothetical protein VAK19_002785 [Enterobacter asburiae]|uniref:hypothetical protein n=1 Tax=Enterobacteriaceae TaxID=543 RepID=UPI000B9C6E78|nr:MULTISPECIES: hypothetical protein [Enterobacteriaceae]EMB8996273.1 hypothetical protein [Enterobacter asburiae]HDR2724545.1 hypothetical protein [Enterobacter roggenkampii]ELG6165450.1 hypothetical protein [Escherichia coli]MCD9243037.1 hypothetical protein [Escherichia coli]UNM47017.1 hypothetical protein B7D33_17445 [Klebsiella pneumoniae]
MLNHIERFENLGDNCEFAFYLRSSGVDEGSLFRWTLVKNHWSLLKLIQSDFKGLFELENLQPSWHDMVLDTKYDLCFHTKMYSENQNGKWSWNQNKKELNDIFIEEKNKISYLVSKFKSSLSNKDKIFVIKNNANDLDQLSIDLAKEISKHGDAKILHVKSDMIDYTNNKEKIERLSSNLYLTYIDKFAAYNKADDVSKNGWDNVIRNALLEM